MSWPDHGPGVIPDVEIDVTREMCPMSFVRVKLALEAMHPGQLLEVRLRGSEALENVPRSTREAGHQVASLRPDADGPGLHRLVIIRA